jgi:hypothetical protein
MPPTAPATAAPPAISGPRAFDAAAPTVSVTVPRAPAPLLADAPLDDRLAGGLRAAVRRERVDAALPAAAERERVLRLL